MDGDISTGQSGKSFPLQGRAVAEQEYSRNLPFKAKMFRATTATATRGLPGFIRVPTCGIVGHSSLELGNFV